MEIARDGVEICELSPVWRPPDAFWDIQFILQLTWKPLPLILSTNLLTYFALSLIHPKNHRNGWSKNYIYCLQKVLKPQKGPSGTSEMPGVQFLNENIVQRTNSGNNKPSLRFTFVCRVNYDLEGGFDLLFGSDLLFGICFIWEGGKWSTQNDSSSVFATSNSALWWFLFTFRPWQSWNLRVSWPCCYSAWDLP